MILRFVGGGHYAQVLRYLPRRTRTGEEAEDLAQAVFADAAERLREFEAGSTPVLAWLYTVAQRRLADRGRLTARRPETVAAPRATSRSSCAPDRRLERRCERARGVCAHAGGKRLFVELRAGLIGRHNRQGLAFVF